MAGSSAGSDSVTNGQTPDGKAGKLLEDVFREDWRRVLASLVGWLGDIELAEDAAQDAFATAAERWPRDGVPGNPTGWLIATARDRAVDRAQSRFSGRS